MSRGSLRQATTYRPQAPSCPAASPRRRRTALRLPQCRLAARHRRGPDHAHPGAFVGDRHAHREARAERRAAFKADEVAALAEIGRDPGVNLLSAAPPRFAFNSTDQGCGVGHRGLLREAGAGDSGGLEIEGQLGGVGGRAQLFHQRGAVDHRQPIDAEALNHRARHSVEVWHCHHGIGLFLSDQLAGVGAKIGRVVHGIEMRVVPDPAMHAVRHAGEQHRASAARQHDDAAVPVRHERREPRCAAAARGVGVDRQRVDAVTRHRRLGARDARVEYALRAALPATRRSARGASPSSFRHSGQAAPAARAGIAVAPVCEYGFRARAFGASRNDGVMLVIPASQTTSPAYGSRARCQSRSPPTTSPSTM